MHQHLTGRMLLSHTFAAIHKNIVKALRILREELGQKGNQNEF